MNEHAKIKTPAAPTSVTTGPVAGSRKVYASPQAHADINVPFREIVLTDVKTDLRKITVTITYKSGPTTRSYSLTALISTFA